MLRMHRNVFERLEKVYQIVYFIAKEEQPFTNLPKIMQLEKLHGVDLGSAYQNDKACQKFSKYIAQILRKPLQDHMMKPTTKYRYHSVFTDGTTDKSTMEREVVYVKVLVDGEVHMKMIG